MRLLRKLNKPVMLSVIPKWAVVGLVVYSLTATAGTTYMYKWGKNQQMWGKTQHEAVIGHEKEIANLKVEIERLNSLDVINKQLESKNQEFIQENLELITKADSVAEENNQLREVLFVAMQSGVARPDSIRSIRPETISRGGLPRDRYLGVWEGTAYTATPGEGWGDASIMASGRRPAPGYSIAVDTDYWPLGTKFYIEGFGIVEAEDTGSAIKGQNRFDILVSDKDFAATLGRFQAKVWLYSKP